MTLAGQLFPSSGSWACSSTQARIWVPDVETASPCSRSNPGPHAIFLSAARLANPKQEGSYHKDTHTKDPPNYRSSHLVFLNQSLLTAFAFCALGFQPNAEVRRWLLQRLPRLRQGPRGQQTQRRRAAWLLLLEVLCEHFAYVWGPGNRE